MYVVYLCVNFSLQFYCSQECLDRLDSARLRFKPFQAALLVRAMSVMLLTDWGYNVAVFDLDAFILQEPFAMYLQVTDKLGADIISQRAVFPPEVARRIGFTLCMGAVFYCGGSPHLSEFRRLPKCKCKTVLT